MAWVVIRIADNHKVATATPEERHGLWQRGDVVEVLDVHPGRKVTESDKLLAIEVQGVAAETLREFVEPGPIGRRLRRWRVTAALQAMPAQVRQRILDAVQNRQDISITAQQAAWLRDYMEARV